MSKLTYLAAKLYLEVAKDHYFITRAIFLDLSGGRTRVIFDMKKALCKFLLKQFPQFSLNYELCEYTFQDLFELLDKFNEYYPEGKITFSESETGMRIMFDTKGLNKNIQSDSYKTHTINDARELSENVQERSAGSKTVYYDRNMGRTRMIIQLDSDRCWLLSIYFDDTTEALLKYELGDVGSAHESYYEFKNEAAIREKIYQAGDEEKYLEDLFIRFIEEHSGEKLEAVIRPYVTAQYHYD